MTSRIVVIGGGQNVEHDVSLASAAAVGKALRSTGEWDVDCLTIDPDGRWRREREPLGADVAESLAEAVRTIGSAEVVFPAVHGPLGEDGALAALCALANVPVVGSALGPGAIGMDKWATKLVANAVGIRTAPGTLVRADAAGQLEFDKEVVVKPVCSGSSHGVSLARTPDELAAAIRTAGALDDRILIEQVVHGREVDVAVIREADGNRWPAPPLEIHSTGLFDTVTKYDGSAQFTVPAVLTDDETEALTTAACTMFDALGCEGLARIDFFLTEDGPVLNEVNTMPGLTEASQVPRMFRAAGIEYPELMSRLARAAIANHAASEGAAARPAPDAGSIHQ